MIYTFGWFSNNERGMNPEGRQKGDWNQCLSCLFDRVNYVLETHIPLQPTSFTSLASLITPCISFYREFLGIQFHVKQRFLKIIFYIT